MEKKELGVGQYVTTGTMFIRSEFKPEETKMAFTEQWKAAILECLTESDEFHKLVCDITGVERKQEKVSQELEKLKEDYSHMCENYEHEKQKRNDFIRLYKEENAKRLEVERERDCSKKHYKFIMDEITSMLKEVECGSVRGIVDVLKAERANGKLLAEQYELSKNENDKLAKLLREIEGKYDRIAKGYDNACKEAKTTENIRKSLSANYDRLAEDYNCLNTLYNNQKEYIANYIEENKQLTDKVEKLEGKLDKASKQYGELIKIINDKSIKSI